MQIATKARQAIWGLTPDEQRRENAKKIRSEVRKIENNKRNIALQENKSVKHLRDTSRQLQKRGIDPAKDPAVRKLALGVVRAKTQQKRLAMASAQMGSIQRQLTSNQSIEVMEESMKQATKIMKSANTQIKLPQMMATTRNFEAEQMKADTYQEMVDDLLDDPMQQSEDFETEDELAEVNQLLNGILKRSDPQPQQQLPASSALEAPDVPISADAVITAEEEAAADEMMDEQMKGRMEALRSS